MDTIDTDRRQFLGFGGAGTVLALAGCLDVLDSGGNSSPSYTDDLIADEDGNLVAFYSTWGEEAGFEDDEDETDSDDGTDNEDSMGNLEDPLLAPVGSALVIGLFSGFTLGFTPLSPVLGPENGGFGGTGGTENESDAESGPAVETEITEVLMMTTDDAFAFVMRGDIDRDEVGTLLTGESDIMGVAPVTYTESGSNNGYTTYEIAGDIENDSNFNVDVEDAGTVAVGDDSIVVGTAESVDRFTGDASNPAEEFDTLEWLLGTAGDGEFGVTMHAPAGLDEANLTGDNNESNTGPDPGMDSDLDEEAEDILEDLDVTPLGLSGTIREESDEQAAVDMGIAFESTISEEARSAIESEFGTEAEDRSFDFQDNRVAISGTYTEESVQN
jgi:hypothetical protein